MAAAAAVAAAAAAAGSGHKFSDVCCSSALPPLWPCQVLVWFQSQLPHQRKYRHVLPSLVTIAREEGVRALYRGFLPKAVRLGVGQSIGLVTFRQLLKVTGAEEHDAT
eukprot:jgi/Chrzof1/5377/Cz16g00180.t1